MQIEIKNFNWNWEAKPWNFINTNEKSGFRDDGFFPFSEPQTRSRSLFLKLSMNDYTFPNKVSLWK